MGRPKKQPEAEVAEASIQEVQLAPADGSFGYVCNWDIKYNGRRYAPGDQVEVDASAAAALIAAGAISAK